jgi:hypothetical protein
MAWLLSLPVLSTCIQEPVFRRSARLRDRIVLAVGAAHLRMANWLAPALEGRDLEEVGVVAGLPAVSERSVRFEFAVESSDHRRTCNSMASNEDLKPCPACGKQAGELIENKAARFAFRVQCRACGWTTDQVKIEPVAVKLWNEAKRESNARARPK